MPKPVPPRGRRWPLVVAARLPPLVAERERLLALMPAVGWQTEARHPMLEWPDSLPPQQVWVAQMEAEGLVVAWDPGHLRAVDLPVLGPGLSGALRRELSFSVFT